jgi:tetratricopeptide (TPR) repeat protein
MSQFWGTLLLVIFLTSCGNSSVTVTKSQTVEYLSKAFSKSKKWLKSSNGDDIPDGGPPPPSSFQPTEREVRKKRSEQSLTHRMSRGDYLRAIQRLENSIPELEKKLGSEDFELGETHYTIGSMHLLQGNKHSSKIAFKRALEIFSKCLGSEHPRVWRLKDKISNIN